MPLRLARRAAFMHPGILYAASAYVLWGLFPLYFSHLSTVPATEVLVHRVVWSLVFVLAVLAWRRQWAWLAPTLRQPKVLGAFVASALLLSCNWLTYIWSVNHGHVVDASLGCASSGDIAASGSRHLNPGGAGKAAGASAARALVRTTPIRRNSGPSAIPPLVSHADTRRIVSGESQA